MRKSAMSELPGIRSFLAQYFPVFMGAICAAVFSLVFAVPLIFDSYFPRLPMDDTSSVPSRVASR